MDHPPGRLADIRVDRVRPNPENPRVAFRQGELEQLQESIRQYGIQVPVVVYKRGPEYVLIDGERRWRCASKLNLQLIPALVQEEPSALDNLLLMFNIHALREDWDLFTIALKLPRVIDLLEKENGGGRPTESELAAKTGLSRGMVRRCRLLIDLPSNYQHRLLEELKKPKSKQVLSEDLFIEMERAMNAVARSLPEAIRDKSRFRDALVHKYENGTIDSIVDFRLLPKIARAERVGGDRKAAADAIQRVLSIEQYSIKDAWRETVSEAYTERDIATRIESLIVRLDGFDPASIDEDVRDKLVELVERARAILKASQ